VVSMNVHILMSVSVNLDTLEKTVRLGSVSTMRLAVGGTPVAIQ
jgi:hypothetical protein